MKSSRLSTMSKFGKFFTKDQIINSSSQIIKTIELKQNFSHQKPLIICKFNLTANKLYLIDSNGTLIGLNLIDNTISTLKDQKIQHFAIDGNNPFSILFVNKKSQLYKVNFENKKTTKIMNLNLSRILAFERNYLRQLLLVLDYKILMLYDLTNPTKIRSLKAGYDEVFTNACFASNNRFIILAVKNIEIKVLEIMNFKILHKIRLPFQIQELKIQISYDCKKISIYGKCHIIFFISFNQNMQLSYQLVELPQIKAIRQLKYTYDGQIVFLGNDQVIYAISADNYKRMVPVFNNQQKIRLMGFDVSLDTKSMAVVSSRTVFTVIWKYGLRKLIDQTQQFKPIDFIQNMQQNQMLQKQKQKQENVENDQYQYDEEEQQSEQKNIKQGVERSNQDILNNEEKWKKIQKQQNMDKYQQAGKNRVESRGKVGNAFIVDVKTGTNKEIDY